MFKVGDRVKIKKLRGGRNKYGVYITPDMENMSGEVQTITGAKPGSNFMAYRITNSQWWWTEEEFERSVRMM